jgi:hydroxymethylglutaryl-CoA lyase
LKLRIGYSILLTGSKFPKVTGGYNAMNKDSNVKIYEVGLRDGLQLESKILTVDEKMELFLILQKANVDDFEFGSFVQPKQVPQMANAAEFYGHLQNYKNQVNLTALVPNLKGLEMAKEVGVTSVNYVFSASDTHNQQNVRKTTKESIESLEYLSQFASDHNIKLNVTIATSFGCPFEGKIPQERIMNILENLLSYNLNKITLADTTGMANPKQVYQLTKEVVTEWKNINLGCHFHNTRGMGLANILASLESGITTFDASLGGIGGCPFAPGATGNVCTEDVVHMLEEMGVNTSINLDRLIEASHKLAELLGHELPGQVAKAGKSSKLYPIPKST